jgi:hypothetical protein
LGRCHVESYGLSRVPRTRASLARRRMMLCLCPGQSVCRLWHCKYSIDVYQIIFFCLDLMMYCILWIGFRITMVPCLWGYEPVKITQHFNHIKSKAEHKHPLFPFIRAISVIFV